jgi:cell division protein FtsI (penicillin-binding protein 3)
MSIKRDILWRIYLAFILVCLLGIGIIAQVGKIQFVEGKYWRSMADSLTTAYLPIEADRGNVLSNDGSLLATSLPFFEIRFDVNTDGLSSDTFNYYVGVLAEKMAAFFKDNSAQHYKQKLITARKNNKRYLLIQKGVTYPELQIIKTWPIFNKGRNKGGFIVVQRHKRVQPFNMLASRTIGFKRDEVSAGVEGSFNELLAGLQGKQLMQRLSGDLWVPVNDEEEISSVHGNDVVTTIDIELQDVLEHALLAALDSHKANHGSAVLMEVQTGKIKAIANLGKTKDGNYWEQYNYAIGEATEPGSTFKLMSALALLEDGLVNRKTIVDVEKGSKSFYNKNMHDSEHHNMTEITLQKAFEKSSNVAFAKLIDQHYQHNPQKFLDRIAQTGLNEPLGFELAGEPKPYIKERKDKSWSGITLPWMAVGYEMTLTPLQMLTLYNAVANNGKSVRPYIVEKIQQNGITIDSFETVVLKEKICSDNTLKQLRAMLEGVVDSGTATNVKNPYYKIAGKTGTAKMLDKEFGYKQKTSYQASFCGYFPVENPRYSCVVVISSPSAGLYYGSKVAAPVFKEVADKIYSTSFDMHKELNDSKKILAENFPSNFSGCKEDVSKISKTLGFKSVDAESESDWVACATQNNALKFSPKNITEKHVPDVTGMGLRDALYLLESMGLRVKVIGKGIVKKQSLIAGEKIESTKEIIIELS